MILRLIAIALLDLPQAVILPGQHVVRVGLERALIPGLRQLVIAELAVGVADQIGHVRMIVVTERLQLPDRVGIFVAVVDRRIGGAIAFRKSGIVETGLLVLFLGLLRGAGAGGLPVVGRRGRLGRIAARATTTATGGERWNQRGRHGKRHR